MTASPTRRTLLGAALVVPLAACSPSGDRPPGPCGTEAVDPDVALRTAALDRETALLASYDLALAAFPRFAAQLGPIRAEHAAHLAALQEPAALITPTPAGSPVGATPTIGTLVAAERAAAQAHAVGARTASPALAQVLASLAASEASHEIALAR